MKPITKEFSHGAFYALLMLGLIGAAYYIGLHSCGCG